MTELRSRFARVLALTLGLGAAYGCTGGLSCGSSSGCLSAYDFPQTAAQVPNGNKFVDDGVRMRMTQNALDFLAQNIKPILIGALGSDPNNPDNILISSTTPLGVSGFQLAQGENETHPTEVYINAQVLADTLEIEFVGDNNGEPDGIRIRAVDVPVGFDGRLFTDFGIGNAACDIFGTNSDYGGYPYVTGMTFEAIIKPRVGHGAADGCDGGAPECLRISVDVTDVQIGSFGAGALELDKPPVCPPFNACGTFSCPSAQSDGLGACSEDCSDTRVPLADENGDLECDGVCRIEKVAVDFISAIGGFVLNLIEGFLPGILENAVQSALADFDGSPLAAAGRLNLATFAPGVLPASALDMGFAVGPTTGAFDVNAPAAVDGAQGMDLIFKSGFEAAPSLVDDTPVPHPCVRAIKGNDFSDLYGAFEFEAPDAQPLTGVFNGEVYALGASLAKGALNQMLFATYNSGALCIEASTDSIHQLTGGAFPLSAATLDLLTSGKLRQYTALDAPAIVALAPSQPPVIDYGAGDDTEGHIKVSWPKVEVSFYVLINERFSRVFAVATDISLQLTVFNDPATSTLRVAVIDGPNIENFTETYNELLPGVAFTEILETLIGTAFDAVLGDGLEFNFDVGPVLSNALNGAPVFVDFKGIETTPADDRQFLNVYLGLTSTQPQPRIAGVHNVRLAAEPGVLRAADAEDPSVVVVRPTGEVRLEADNTFLDDQEYFAKVDFGAWRGPYRADAEGIVVVRDPKLRLVGEHTVTLRSRFIGEPNSLEPAGEAVTVWVDAEAPRVELKQQGQDVVASGWDIGSPLEDLTWQWQLDDGEWSDPSNITVRPLEELFGRRVAVRAIDKAGNVSKSAGLDLTVAKRRAAEELKMAGGCAQTGTDAAWLGGLALALAFAIRRRRR
jgi:MYXO-CTERM domain-containing protein